MTRQIAFIHTSPTMIPVFKPLAAELLPRNVNVFNMVDESLLCDIIREKGCLPITARRLVSHVIAADEAGAEFILVTCSSMGRAVEASRGLVRARVLRVDEPMADRAVSTAKRIGVIATLPSTLEPTVTLIQERARAMGKSVVVHPLVVEGAFEAVMAGDGAKHDSLIAAELKDLSQTHDVIVLAQASMARVVDALPPKDKPVPILSSPRLAVEHLASMMRA